MFIRLATENCILYDSRVVIYDLLAFIRLAINLAVNFALYLLQHSTLFMSTNDLFKSAKKGSA